MTLQTWHILNEGRALCGKAGPPGSWDPEHIWIGLSSVRTPPETGPVPFCSQCVGVLAARRELPYELAKLLIAIDEAKKIAGVGPGTSIVGMVNDLVASRDTLIEAGVAQHAHVLRLEEQLREAARTKRERLAGSPKDLAGALHRAVSDPSYCPGTPGAASWGRCEKRKSVFRRCGRCGERDSLGEPRCESPLGHDWGSWESEPHDGPCTHDPEPREEKEATISQVELDRIRKQLATAIGFVLDCFDAFLAGCDRGSLTKAERVAVAVAIQAVRAVLDGRDLAEEARSMGLVEP